MGAPKADPYSDLRGQFEVRRNAYLTMLTSSKDELASDPLKFGTAKRRGYLRSPRSAAPGPKPTFSFADQKAGADSRENKLSVWTDDPRQRAGPYEPWDDEDVRLAIARLHVHHEPLTFLSRLWIDAEPPPPDTTHGLGFGPLFLLARQLGVVDRGSVPRRVAAVLASAGDMHVGLPDYNPLRTFDAPLIDEIAGVVDQGGLIDGAADVARLAGLLAGLTVEETTAPITEVDARTLVQDLARVLPGRLIDSLLHALVERAHPGPYVLPPDLHTPPPSSWEPPPPSREIPPNSREQPPAAGWEKPPNTYQDPHARPKPPPPRGRDVLLKLPLECVRNIAALGTICGPIWTVRYALKGLQAWTHAPYGDDGAYLENLSADSRVDLIEDLFGRNGIVPEEFKFPEFTRTGIYWWRAVIKTHCIEHCFALKDTADFHSTDLIRLLMLFGDDNRIDERVRDGARLALRYLKYWIDQPPAKQIDGSEPEEEMTFWSENHQILFAQSELLAGLLLPDKPFPRAGLRSDGSPQTGSDHVAGGLTRSERWLDNRLRFGFAEWNSPGYYNEDLTPLFNLVDFCARPWPALATDQRAALDRIGVKAAMALDLIVFDFARFTCRGSFGVTAGRAYWSAKAYGWEQSVGNIIEMLFGTRGDYLETEPGAVALATSNYQVPDALIGIGLDRSHLDRDQHFVDRSRVSIGFDDAGQYGIGFDSEDDITFWWGLGAYFTPSTLEGTKRVVAAHPNLRHSNPFKLLYVLGEKWGIRFLTDMAGAIIDAAKIGIWWAIPWPANVVMMILSGDNVVEDLVGLVKNLWDAVKTIAHAVEKAIVSFLGFDSDDEEPSIPSSTLQKLLEALLITFNRGSVLSRANICTFSDGDTMLSSTQSRSVGMPSSQTHPVEACLGLEACVWTTARFMNTDAGSFIAGAEKFLWDFERVHLEDALADLAFPVAFSSPIAPIVEADDLFGNDGPNYWTGSLALPMVVQHERAAIAIYDISVDLRRFSGASTHAWFPRAMFDQTDKEDASGGTWFFGRKDTWTPDGAERVGSGYVALFSALQADWTNDSDPNPWNGKEIQAKGGSNIWIYVVGNEHDFGDFDTFRAEVLAAHLNVSGVGSLLGLECSFDVPRTSCPAGRAPRLEAFYGDRRGRFAGDDLELDGFPRFENRYVQQLSMGRRGGSGLKPQVQTLESSTAVGFGSRAYRLAHPLTGMTLEHDLDAPRRTFTRQPEPTLTLVPPRRLVDDALTSIRVTDPRRRLQAHKQVEHLNALSRRRLR
jgi:hypothetical protein